MATQCTACGGIYESRQPDGTDYYHACPPITKVAVRRAGQVQFVELADVRPTDEVRVYRGGKPVTVLVSALLVDDRRIGDVTVERPNKRDERHLPQTVDGKVVGVPIAEGAGVVEVPSPVPPVEDVFRDEKPVVP